MSEACLAPIDEARYMEGWEAGRMEYQPGEPIPEPIWLDEDFAFGYDVGVGEAMAWHEGYAAGQAGLGVCPYTEGADDECFRGPWLNGFMLACRDDDGEAIWS